MECLFVPELKEEITDYLLPDEEISHVKAFHLKDDDKVLVTNGQGLTALANIKFNGKKNIIVKPFEFFTNLGEPEFRIGLAMGIIDNRERLEFAFEKCIELGMTDFFPLSTDYTQRKTINSKRLKQKAISSIKQCNRSRLPEIYPPSSINEFLDSTSQFTRLILADKDSEINSINKLAENTIVLIGPEGGFSEKEIKAISEDKRNTKIKIGSRILRSETAAVAAFALIT